MPAKCIPLSGSTSCPAFNASSVSTNPALFGDFPFLQYVSDVAELDKQLDIYAKSLYVKKTYVDILGCHGVNLTNTDDYYARYTVSSICNGLVQSSKDDCNLSPENSRPLCADSCALMATSEEEIVVNQNLCRNPESSYMDQVRALFTVCALPANSITGTCVHASQNEPDNCGYGPNLLGLCQFCRASTVNDTDTCCLNSNATGLCTGVKLPIPTQTLQPVVASSTSGSSVTATAAPDRGLSGGQIAGAVIGSLAGLALVLTLAAFCLLWLRRRRRTGRETHLNQPNPQRRGVPMQYARSHPSYEVVPGARVARMSALREMPSKNAARSPSASALAGGAKYSDSSDAESYGASPGAMSKRIPPVTGRRNGSLSSASVFAGAESDTSPRSAANAQFSSPEGVASGQSEQLPFFRDYYSEDDIHPGDVVSVLWAYQPRAGDEFELDRGEMLKIIGIWDDGWATGVRLSERAEDFNALHREQRDSGVSNISQRPMLSPQASGEIKAFPLVCVCLPQHWGKIIDGDSQGLE